MSSTVSTRTERNPAAEDRIERLFGRKVITHIYDEAPRAAADTDAAVIRAMLPKGSKLHSSGIMAAKAYAKDKGVKGGHGGWIYTANGRPICQGWAEYAIRLYQRRHISATAIGTLIHCADFGTESQEVIRMAYAWEVAA
jgi:hypothetical protein